MSRSSGPAAAALSVHEFDLHDVGARYLKRGGADPQIEMPVAQELLVVTQRRDLAFRALHPDQPFAQRAGIVLAETEGARELQSRPLGLFAEARQRRQHAAGKDI